MRDAAAPAVPPGAWQHIGLYVYRRDVAAAAGGVAPSTLERVEGLEQLRALEHGFRIRAVETREDSIGVDTPEDLARVRALALDTPAALAGRGAHTS